MVVMDIQMKTNILLKFSHVDWKRVWVVSTAAGTAWAMLGVVLPAKFHVIVNAVLGSITIFIGIIIRGSKYVQDRNELPPPGTPLG